MVFHHYTPDFRILQSPRGNIFVETHRFLPNKNSRKACESSFYLFYCRHFFQKHQFHAGDIVKCGVYNAYLSVAQGLIHPPGANIFCIGIQPQIGLLLFCCLLLGNIIKEDLCSKA